MRAARTLLIGAAIAALLATGCEWHFETLDGNGGPNGRVTTDVGEENAALLYNGRPHVFYHDDDNGELRHGYWNGLFWAFETLDGAGGPNGRTTNSVGMTNAALLYNGRPHVFYRDNTDRVLRHAYWNGSFWAFETLDGNGGPNGRTTNEVGFASAAVLYNGRPHVFYREDTNNDLRHAYWNGSFWAFETLDGAGGPNGRINADVARYNAVVLYNGRPHVFYRDQTNGNLRHAYWNGLFWAFETLDGAGGPNGRIDADVGRFLTVVLYNGRPHVFYYDLGNGDLRHAYWNGLFWAFETLDGAGGPNGRINADVCCEQSASILYDARPHVFYRDNTSNDLRHAYWNGQFWAFETLDGNGGPNGRTTNNVGLDNAAILYNALPHVFYFDDTGEDLRHAYFG